MGDTANKITAFPCQKKKSTQRKLHAKSWITSAHLIISSIYKVAKSLSNILINAKSTSLIIVSTQLPFALIPFKFFIARYYSSTYNAVSLAVIFLLSSLLIVLLFNLLVTIFVLFKAGGGVDDNEKFDGNSVVTLR